MQSHPKWREYIKAKARKPKTKLTDAQLKRKQAKKDKEAQEAEELMRKIRGNQQERASGGGSTALSAKRWVFMSVLLFCLVSPEKTVFTWAFAVVLWLL